MADNQNGAFLIAGAAIIAALAYVLTKGSPGSTSSGSPLYGSAVPAPPGSDRNGGSGTNDNGSNSSSTGAPTPPPAGTSSTTVAPNNRGTGGVLVDAPGATPLDTYALLAPAVGPNGAALQGSTIPTPRNATTGSILAQLDKQSQGEGGRDSLAPPSAPADSSILKTIGQAVRDSLVADPEISFKRGVQLDKTEARQSARGAAAKSEPETPPEAIVRPNQAPAATEYMPRASSAKISEPPTIGARIGAAAAEGEQIAATVAGIAGTALQFAASHPLPLVVNTPSVRFTVAPSGERAAAPTPQVRAPAASHPDFAPAPATGDIVRVAGQRYGRT